MFPQVSVNMTWGHIKQFNRERREVRVFWLVDSASSVSSSYGGGS